VTRILVAGAGLAALRTVEQLRAAGWSRPITVIGAEPHPPYNRPPLTKEALRTGISPDVLHFPQRPATADVEWRLGRRVEAVDLLSRRATLDDGDVLGYDGLVIATGVRSRTLPLGGHRIRTIDDAQRLRSELVPGARVTVIGAGFIGCEIAATAASLGCIVTVVEPLDAPLQVAVGRLVGDELRRRHEEQGVRFRLGHSVVRADGAVVLDDGSRIGTDVIVEAVGSVPNVEWLDGNGLDLSNGVRCDAELHPVTESGPVNEVVAVGDIVRFPDPRFGTTRIEHWTLCGETARYAAISLIAGITGVPSDQGGFAPMPTFWSEQFGTRLQSFGMPGLGCDDVRLLEGELAGDCAVGYHRDGILVGVVLLGLRNRMLEFRQRLTSAVVV